MFYKVIYSSLEILHSLRRGIGWSGMHLYMIGLFNDGTNRVWYLLYLEVEGFGEDF